MVDGQDVERPNDAEDDDDAVEGVRDDARIVPFGKEPCRDVVVSGCRGRRSGG